MFSLNFKNAMPLAAAVTALFIGASAAQAVTCPASADGTFDASGGGDFTRQFTLTANGGQSISCYAFGKGNINGSATDDPILTGSDTGTGNNINSIVYSSGVTPISDLVLLDKNDDTKGLFVDTISGVTDTSTGTLFLSAISGYSNFILAIKSGNNDNPTWAAFSIGALGSFDWLIDDSGGNSHTNLYGVKDNGGGIGAIPVPAGLPLLLTAMGLGGFMSWRKRKTV
ncbi:hypothetical protein [Roseovarius sp.]|jgi:hypothetical protein